MTMLGMWVLLTKKDLSCQENPKKCDSSKTCMDQFVTPRGAKNEMVALEIKPTGKQPF